MKIISALSDRLVQFLVPSTTASADCGICQYTGQGCGPGLQGSVYCCPNPSSPTCELSCWCVR